MSSLLEAIFFEELDVASREAYNSYLIPFNRLKLLDNDIESDIRDFESKWNVRWDMFDDADQLNIKNRDEYTKERENINFKWWNRTATRTEMGMIVETPLSYTEFMKIFVSDFIRHHMSSHKNTIYC